MADEVTGSVFPTAEREIPEDSASSGKDLNRGRSCDSGGGAGDSQPRGGIDLVKSRKRACASQTTAPGTRPQRGRISVAVRRPPSNVCHPPWGCVLLAVPQRCEHCKRLEPEYVQVAKDLEGEGLVLGKVRGETQEVVRRVRCCCASDFPIFVPRRWPGVDRYPLPSVKLRSRHL